MAGITFSNYSPSNAPAWVGDVVERSTNLAGGARIDTTEFTADADGVIYIESGTLLGRTFAERDAGTGFGPADTTTPDDEIYLLLYDVTDAAKDADCELYRHGALVKENYLPTASRAAGPLAAIRERYETTIGGA